ncbi:unnamed protein product [Camellia sinensis]
MHMGTPCMKEKYKPNSIKAVAVVHSYEDGMPAGSHKTRLTALNVPPMGLFYPMLLVPDVHPPPPRFWFNDYEDMLEDTWHMEFPRRSDMSDGLYSSINGGFPMWDSYSFFQSKPKKEDCIGLAEAITKSILSTGFGGVALTAGLISAAEESYLVVSSEGIYEKLTVRHSKVKTAFEEGSMDNLSTIVVPLKSAGLLYKNLQNRSSNDEAFKSIIIMPAFGVQLETHYSRCQTGKRKSWFNDGRIIHRFIPIEKILKPVLNECVTPVTCYWNLSLIVREEEELVLVFKELHPPVKMLIPIWKALCAATDNPVTQVPSR